MEPQNTHISSTNHEERPLPRLPDSELTRQDPLELQPSRPSTTLPLCFRASTRDINTSRTERDTVRPELYYRQSTSTIAPRFPVISVPARTSSQTSGASLNDHSNFMSNLDQIIDTYMPYNSNNVRQIADRQVSRSSGFISNDNMRSCYQNSQFTARLMPRSNSPGNDPSSSRLLLPTTSTITSPKNSDNEEMRTFATPRWQLDSEVNVCPICKSRFGFFLRKHHCRRCGRVVCDSCSPHRITIPFQYIVQPSPQGEASVTLIPRIRQTEIDNSLEYIGGGRQVRLCNPCVPDPNTTPARVVVDQNRRHGENLHNIFNQSAPTQTMEPSLSMISHSPRQPSSAVSSNPSTYSIQQSSARNRPQTSRIDDLSHRAAHTRRRDRGLRQGSLSSRSRSNTVGVYSHSNQYGNSSSLPSDTLIHQNSCPMSLSNHQGRSLPHPPSSTRPQISEADECWICHEELPSNSLEDFEELRTAHVSACVRHAIQLASGSRKVNDAYVPRGGNLSEQGAENITNYSGDLASMRANPQHNGLSAGFKLERERRTGVFPYKATEKDCIDDAECAICLEEFEIGIEMGRLECFCRFHLKCIRDWFKTQSGQCPIHQHGGGY
ncbi:putative fyve zinc finger protein [Erysiphe neolycopersici]|uniref:RING-type E3 ubiquitin transferase n=1 Tax=Erysiphe neolycopersici TaxID=212602 RepID=A0A420HS11_9PEZI|nr:putative fyve zinc finger protein [Erysiphe neolycopersici]